MEIILRQHVEHLGERGEFVDVAPGYARNYLLPRKLALPATVGNKKHVERERLIVEARESEAKGQAEAQLSGAMSKFMLVVENYPELKANTNFLALQEELTSTENKIAFSRQSYNDQVLFYNNKIEVFPSNMLRNMFNFTKSSPVTRKPVSFDTRCPSAVSAL